MQIHESSEDYLESILMLKRRKGFVRSIDIANELDYTKASVSIAMKKSCGKNGYIEVDAEGFITPSHLGPQNCSPNLRPPQAADGILCPPGREPGDRCGKTPAKLSMT